MSKTPAFPAPVPTRDSAPFWEAAKQDILLIQRCTDCGQAQFYPRGFCIHCLSEHLEWIAASGQGHIQSFTICYMPGHPAMAGRVPYAMALVDLAEGVRMLAEIQDADLAKISVGDAVKVVFEQRADGWTLPQFTPLNPSGVSG
jgi:uncharacterized OB-fold protein